MFLDRAELITIALVLDGRCLHVCLSDVNGCLLSGALTVEGSLAGVLEFTRAVG